MSTAEELASLSKLLSEVVWCGQRGSRLTWPNRETIEIAEGKEDELRGRILPLLQSLERNAFDSLNLQFSKKVSRPLAPNPYWNEMQFAERAAWGISVIAQYLDQTYAEQIDELVSRLPEARGNKVQNALERALNRIST